MATHDDTENTAAGSEAETTARFALRLELVPLLEAIAGLLPGIITPQRLHAMVIAWISAKTVSPELSGLREVRLFLGPTAELGVPNKRQMQLRLSGDWDSQKLMTDLTAHPSCEIRVEEQDGRKRLRFGHLKDFSGYIGADGTLIIVSDDLPSEPTLEVPRLPPDFELMYSRKPLFAFARRGGAWWQVISEWVNRTIAGSDASLAQTLNESGQHACLYLDDHDDLIVEIEQGDVLVAEKLRERLETLRQTWADHLSPERLEPGPQNAASPVFAFFTMPLSAAMPVLRLLRHVLQQITVSCSYRVVRLCIPLRVAFAALSSPIALISLLPVVPALIAAASAAAKPAVAGVYDALMDGGCAAARQSVANACRLYCMDHVSAGDPEFCPDLVQLLAEGYLQPQHACSHGGIYQIRREGDTFIVTCSVHRP